MEEMNARVMENEVMAIGACSARSDIRAGLR